ncbi:MAG: uroporphyrinogen-III synthase [Bacteroidales bacterium]|nr:uroporphyrinogen-III synthase [Bacteroidales bacterium]
MKIKKILVSQPEPKSDKSPYFDLAEKNNVKIDFRPFIYVEGVSAKDFRSQKVNIPDYTAVIFTSRNAIDNFFRICAEMRITVIDSMKYFCISESVAYYLQKYIVYRKRKIFIGQGSFPDLIEIINKHNEEKFLVPLSDQHNKGIPEMLDNNGIKYAKAILYRTVNSDLSDLMSINYDLLVFFSPSGIRSLLTNFPEFQQRDIKIASFGESTAKAVKEAGLRLDLKAPLPQAPSMSMALDWYIKENNKNDKK